MADIMDQYPRHVMPEPNSGCWIWIGPTKKWGYGDIRDHPQRYAHRVSYSLSKGQIPGDLCVLHKCDNPLCVNPDHLFAGSQQDNVRDKVSKGRQAYNRGEKCGGAKITDELVRYIRADSRSSRTLAPVIGLRDNTIRAIRRHETWRHVS